VESGQEDLAAALEYPDQTIRLAGERPLTNPSILLAFSRCATVLPGI